MKDRVALALSQLLSKELTASCPEESMSRHLPDVDAEIKQCSFEHGLFVLRVMRNGRPYKLILKPLSWSKDGELP